MTFNDVMCHVVCLVHLTKGLSVVLWLELYWDGVCGK